MFKTRGGGVKGRLNNVKKNCTIGIGRLPLSGTVIVQYTMLPLSSDMYLSRFAGAGQHRGI